MLGGIVWWKVVSNHAIDVVFGSCFMQDRISATAGALCLEEGESVLFENIMNLSHKGASSVSASR
jgi:hypothetical protein